MIRISRFFWRPDSIVAVFAAFTTGCAASRARVVPLPCGGTYAATASHMPPTPQAGEVVAVVVTAWQGASVTIDGSPPAATNSSENWFLFRGVSPGRHVVNARAVALEPVLDTVALGAHIGLTLWIHPTRAAVCPLH